MKTKSSLGITTCVRNQDGQALIFITLAFLVLGMFIGLAVDGGRAYLMRERLRKIVDAAALAGAKAMAAVAAGSDAEAAAKNAACESAMVNGLSRSDCFTEKLAIEIEDLTNPDGTTQRGVVATGTDRGRTFFMSLGALLGCSVCKEINVAATGKAVPDNLADIVVVLDDTGTMKCTSTTGTGANCPIEAAKTGANTLVNMLLNNAGSQARIAFVPFRGCFANDENLPMDPAGDSGRPGNGCIRLGHLVDLTENASTLTSAISVRDAAGGYPGTNICAAMHEGRKKLFGNGSRQIARKIMVILTDGDQKYSDKSGGGAPNLGDPAPHSHPTQRYVTGVGDAGLDPGNCRYTPSGGSVEYGAEHDTAITNIDQKASQKAQSLKSSNGDNIEIYVLRFADPPGDNLSTGTPPGSCDPALIGAFQSNRWSQNDDLDKNLSRCIASNTAMNDPHARLVNDHYFYAANASEIVAQFTAIANEILKKRRLVG